MPSGPIQQSDLSDHKVDAASIRAAHSLIAPFIVDTPVIRSATFSDIAQCQVLFKLENLQMTGSFKDRGGINKLLSLTPAERQRGVIAASAGNHAQSVAYHCKRLGISAKIVMPKHSPLVKIRATRYWGAEVILEGETFDDAFNYSQQLVAQENRLYLHPFDDPYVIEGQGTMGVEILAHALCQDLDAILIPVGGGGLIAGLATFIKQTRPEIQIIGVEESSCNAMAQSRQAGHVVELAPQPIIADGIAVRKVSPRNLNSVMKYVDDMVSVTSDEIANAIMLTMEIEKIVIEGAAAVTVAALMNHRLPALQTSSGKFGSGGFGSGKKVLSILCGGNIDVSLLSRIINRGMAFDGRVFEFELVLMDRPGSLESILGLFRESGANVLEVNHHRYASHAPIGQIAVSVTAETRDQAHIDALKRVIETHSPAHLR
ncbi:MAG: threonine dehydratase [Candidatus Pseudothioglobus sp.]|jgi:threonine dehydratase